MNSFSSFLIAIVPSLFCNFQNRLTYYALSKIADALHYLHTNKPSISHSDINPENIMLNEHNQANPALWYSNPALWSSNPAL
jgi:serine/threonine protein kinase